MKTKIDIYIYLSLLLIFSSCSDDFLQEKKNFGQYDDSFYESEERVNWYLNNIYYDYFQGLTSPVNSIIAEWSNKSNLTEEMGGISDLINPTVTLSNADEGSGYYGTRLENKLKNEPYHRIRDINSLLEEIDIKGETLDEDFRAGIKGQAYYLRAIQYFDLMKIYGGVPLVTSVQEASEDESLKIPRASTTEMVNQIVADLDMAASLLPSNWDGSEYGRFTKGAALAQKCRVLLTYASPLFNNNWESSERWQQALEAGLQAETELSSAGYGLYGNSAKDWEEMFLIDNSFNPEAIVVQLLGSGDSPVILNNSWENDVRLTNQGGSGGLEAPKEMIDLFPMSDGTMATTANGYDDFLFFLDRDPRFYRTFAFSGSKWTYKQDSDLVSNYVWAYRWFKIEGDIRNETFSNNNRVASPAFVRKMSNPEASNESSFEYSGTDIIEYRYAELILNIAEAYAGIGDLNNSVQYLGRVRDRVGIPSSNNYGIGQLTDKYEALKTCLYERRVELAYEGKRFWDIKRWMLYNDDASANNSTCQKLGLQPINGTNRTGHYLQYSQDATTEDPLEDVRTDFGVDPDSEDFKNQLDELADFYSNNFELAELPTPFDNVNGNEVNIDWKQHYYIMGLRSNVLTQNPWLEQTTGWKDASGAEGTFNWKQ
ncbi:RagB/SusD family nutrient uptake outer membrane protein [Zunongwangia sp. HGR-M22]|uniref:RagB/SusD family nutrient uptake outer membrane protein n=1 Tax=Zunongwangia sp. HGR-M22 TaxID=3015168 RepID=UPI0022DDF11C|nr:RagB/SusD family nutrient uptake outer membrane protein [Zunongwangia sp. HGR-M22]WBL24667.1 RagB/SusD family nutrient uptake outer membrane protein [Zunongwangia sp. HGR-M22]